MIVIRLLKPIQLYFLPKFGEPINVRQGLRCPGSEYQSPFAW